MIKRLLSRLFNDEFKWRYYAPYLTYIRNSKRKSYPGKPPHAQLFGPLTLDPNGVFLDDYTRLQPGLHVISCNGIFRVKKYSAIGAGCTVIPGNHIPTVGLPQYLSPLHINDTRTEIVVEEDAWVGARCILLSHSRIGRGAVVGAGSLVTKPIPPYAVAAGSPAKIIAVRFTLEQILRHEAILYPPEERLSQKELETLFRTHYDGLRAIGTSEMNPKDRTLLQQRKQELGIQTYESAE